MDNSDNTQTPVDQSSNVMSRLEIESMIKRYIDELQVVKNKISSQKEMYDAAFENDAKYMEKSEEMKTLKKEVLTIKQKITQDPSIKSIESELRGLKGEQKDVQDALSRFAEMYLDVAKTDQLVQEDGEILRIIKTFKLVRGNKDR